MLPDSSSPHVGIIGGGLAGMATAVALAEHGCRVEVFERRKYLGGRVSSFYDPELGVWLDHCRHVSLGCCTNFHDFCRRLGLADAMTRHDAMSFISADGRRHRFAPSRWLPAPLHLAPALWRLRFLSAGERIAIGRALGRLARQRLSPAAQTLTVEAWLRGQGQSERAVRLFWDVVLLSALSESMDRIAIPVARKVFVDGMMATRDAQTMHLPAEPLHELFHCRAGAALARQGVTVRTGAGVVGLVGDDRRVNGIVLAAGHRRAFDFVVLAVPWRRVLSLVPPDMLRRLPELAAVERFESASITAVHLAFDRPITRLPHAVLPGRLSQWLFAGPAGRGWQAYEVVISASRGLLGVSRDEVVSRVVAELEGAFPEAARAALLHARVTSHPAAVFSPLPGMDAHRPAQVASMDRLMLAGDWTATGWPATMEGAVRSGYLAAEGILRVLGRPGAMLVGDLPRARIARWLLR